MKQSKQSTKLQLWLDMALVGVLTVFATWIWPYLTSRADGPISSLIAAMALYAVWMGIVLAVVTCKEDRALSSLGLMGGLGRQLAIGAALGVLLCLVLSVLPILLGVEPWALLSKFPPDPGMIATYIIYQLFFVSVGEELLFRGYLLERSREIFPGDLPAVLFTAVLFGGMHFPGTGDFMQLAVTIAMGLILGFARVKMKNCGVFAVSFAHAIYNLGLLGLGQILI